MEKKESPFLAVVVMMRANLPAAPTDALERLVARPLLGFDQCEPNLSDRVDMLRPRVQDRLFLR